MTGLGHCTGERACPVRYTDGQSRCCPMHADRDDAGKRAAEFGALMNAPAQWQASAQVVRGTGRV